MTETPFSTPPAQQPTPIPSIPRAVADMARAQRGTPSVECVCRTQGREICPAEVHWDDEDMPALTSAQLAAADVEAAAHHLSMAYEALNRAKERVESSLLLGKLNRAGNSTAGALGAIHSAQYAIRGGHHK